ncbi:kinase-like protein [Marasmius fiardii PR-910]|nr:kinase-like protein [Marasmius fiardii PR-910]
MFTYGKWASSVTPFYQNGSINHYLSNHPKVDPLVLLCGVAEGLAYLHSCTPPISHGDVRGRHIFVKDTDEGGSPTAVISNIGTNYLPTPPSWIIACDDGTRWMAPEVMISESSSSDGSIPSDEERMKLKLKTTTESDVYSFGMTMLEVSVFSLSKPLTEDESLVQQVYTHRTPFPHRRFYSGVIYDVISGIRPSRPGPDECVVSGLKDDVWEVIQWCWRHDPRERPSMATVANALRRILSLSDTTRSVNVVSSSRRQASL